MPLEYQQKQKSAAKQQANGGSASVADRSKPRQTGFDEGSALLTPPVQAKSRTSSKKEQQGPTPGKQQGLNTTPDQLPELPPTPGQQQGLTTTPDQLPELPPTPGQQELTTTPDQLPQAPLNPDQKKAAEDEEEKKNQEKAAQNQQKGVNKWCVYGLDDPSSVSYCIGKQATPDDAANYLELSQRYLKVVKHNAAAYKRYSKVMSDAEIIAITLYTTQASYPMNAVLRGQLKSKPWVDAYGKLAADSAKALKKAPQGAKNAQGSDEDKKLIDASKAEDQLVPIGTVYRSDAWSGFFDPVFASEYRVGRSLEEAGFLSTTLVQGSYGSSMPVRKTIENAKIARSVAEVSAVNTENEALFPPGQRFQISSIELEDTNRGKRYPVSEPQAAFPLMDGSKQAFNQKGFVWHVRLKHVGVAKGKKEDKPDDKKDKKNEKGTQDKGSNEPASLWTLLGIG